MVSEWSERDEIKVTITKEDVEKVERDPSCYCPGMAALCRQLGLDKTQVTLGYMAAGLSKQAADKNFSKPRPWITYDVTGLEEFARAFDRGSEIFKSKLTAPPTEEQKAEWTRQQRRLPITFTLKVSVRDNG
jgi:hypothetical protein